MGVPKFYRWISERYPCLSEVVKEFQIPEFDNLYLDMNGIIHVCSHPEDNNPHFRITEEKIFKDIFHYLEFLFRIIKPRKVFFMAIDGVAPRAKMNQQRGRRFRSAREAEELERKAKESGEVLPTEKRFDSNCITPGTPFMVRLQEQLKYFVTSKISTDPLWSGVNVYLSGHETPGEGEHKIMDFIRHEKSQPNYDPNTRHCLYGLDADLMMLGLATHEPHFSLLREEVRFGGHKDKNKRPATPEETTFHLLHLSLFREYLNFEFCSLENKLPFGYDLENIIDDWVLMGFLVGNDFIPHLPHLHIQHDALPMLWKTYMTVLPECGGYLNEGGYLNLHRFEKYMDELRKFDVEKFNESYTDLKWLEGKLGDKAINAEAAKASQEINAKKRKKNSENQFAPLVNLEDDDDDDIGDEFLPTASQAVALGTESVDMGAEDDSDTFDEEFRLHKCNYYKTKLEYEKVDRSVLKDQAEGYVKALQWILLYYYEGVPSWSWFYPHHYAPYISDVRDFRNMKIEFDLCTPFYPFQQLMAVLPAASKELLPEPYQSLMTQQESSIIDFYPVNFKTDLNGKQQDWEAVVLIPFIDEVRLLEAMTSVEHQLTPEEKGRNIHGPCLMYSHTSDLLDPYPSSLPEAFPDVQMNHARRTDIAIDGFRVESENLIKGLYPGVRLDVYFPGFPTLKHIQHKAYLKKEGVKVFQMNSRNDNMMLKIVDNTETAPDLEVIAKQILGKSIYVGWPHLFEAKVMSVSDDLSRYRLIEQTPMKGGKGKKNSPSQLQREDLNDSETSVWHGEVRSIKERYHDRLGIEVGDTFVLVKACPMVGRKYACGSHGNITLDKQYAQNPVPYVYQATVQDIAVHDDSFCQYKTVSELFKKSDSVFMLGWPHYGSQGEVVDIEEADSIRIRINVSTPLEPNFSKFASDSQRFSVVYYPGYVAAKKVGTSSHFLSRITGSIFVKKGSPESHVDGQNVNIGLNLKFTKRNEEVPGYTKMSNDGWTYSQKTVEVVSHYIEKFPDVLQYISASESGRSDNFFESELFEGKSYTLKDVVDFLKTLECSQLKTMKCGAEILDSGVVQELEKEVAKTVELNKKKTKRVKMQVKPHLLFKPIVGQGGLVPDQSAEYRLFDRVVNIRDGYSVPFGLRGTVVGIHKAEKDIDTIYEVVFDDEFQGGIAVRCSPNRGYRASKSALINLSYGERKNGVGNSQPSSQASTSRQPYAQKQNFQNHSNNSSHHYHQNQSVGGYSEAIQRNHHDNRNRWEGWNMSNHHNQINNRGEFHETKGGKYAQNGTNRSPRNYRPEQNHESDSRHGYQGDRKNVKDTQKNQKPNAPIMNMRQQSFDGSESTNPPTFVTPKVSPGKSMTRNSGVGAQSKIFHDAHNSEFANMWMELSGAGNVNSAKAPPSGNQKQSQQTPAMKDVSEIENHEVPKSKTDQSKSPRTLQDLFSQANKAKMAVSEQSEDKSEINNKDVEDSTLALKQMLKIGSDDDKVTSATETNENTSSNRQPYGRQLSVQELFEGAKQLPPSTNVAPTQLNIPPPPAPVPQYTLIDDQNQQIKQNQKQQRQHQQRQGQGGRGQGQSSQQMAGPHMYQQHGGQQVFINSQRNPVMELVHWCKSVGLLEPKYEFYGQLGSCNCIVSLSNGAKCKGSVTRTQEEAAESAAGAALLQMGAYPGPGMTPPLRMPGFGPPPPMYRQFSSPNSAFKPVSPISPGECPPHFNVPFPFPQHPPPPLQQPPPQRFVPPPPHQHVAGGRHQHQMNPAHMDNRQMYPQGNSYNRSAVRNYNSADSSDRLEERKRRDSETNSKNTPTFVPLQVTRQQKTPQKKRDSESEKEDDHYSKSKGDANTSVSTVSTSDVAKSISKGHNSVTPQQNAASKTVRNNNVGDGKSEILANQDTTPPKHPPQPSQSKKRSRMAANLNFNAS